jgi:ABC-2 type transport system permease protein
MALPGASSSDEPASLESPAKSNGLAGVWRNRYLARLLVKKEIKVRYQGSFLGLLWTYVKPLVRFLVLYFVFGYVLRVAERVENFAVYVFSGIIVVSLFNEALASSTKSIRGNRALINKVFVPRELFPLVSVMVSTRHFLPQLGVLVVIAVVNGWLPSWHSLLYALAGLTILLLFLVGLGLIFSTLNVFFRDAEQVVEVINMVAFWSVPVMYPWTFIAETIGEGPLLTAYLSNPLNIAVNCFHEAFWAPTAENPIPPPDLLTPVLASTGIVVATLIVGQVVFTRTQGRFASEL